MHAVIGKQKYHFFLREASQPHAERGDKEETKLVLQLFQQTLGQSLDKHCVDFREVFWYSKTLHKSFKSEITTGETIKLENQFKRNKQQKMNDSSTEHVDFKQ